MPLVVGIRFRPATKMYYFSPAHLKDLQRGSYVVVETARARELAKVVIPPTELPQEEIVGRLKPVLRIATALDMTNATYHAAQADTALEKCAAKVPSPACRSRLSAPSTTLMVPTWSLALPQRNGSISEHWCEAWHVCSTRASSCDRSVFETKQSSSKDSEGADDSCAAPPICASSFPCRSGWQNSKGCP